MLATTHSPTVKPTRAGSSDPRTRRSCDQNSQSSSSFTLHWARKLCGFSLQRSYQHVGYAREVFIPFYATFRWHFWPRWSYCPLQAADVCYLHYSHLMRDMYVQGHQVKPDRSSITMVHYPAELLHCIFRGPPRGLRRAVCSESGKTFWWFDNLI